MSAPILDQDQQIYTSTGSASTSGPLRLSDVGCPKLPAAPVANESVIGETVGVVESSQTPNLVDHAIDEVIVGQRRGRALLVDPVAED